MKVWKSKPCIENTSSTVMISQVIINAMCLAPNSFLGTQGSKRTFWIHLLFSAFSFKIILKHYFIYLRTCFSLYISYPLVISPEESFCQVPPAIFQDTQLLPRYQSPLFPICFIFTEHTPIHNFLLKQVGLQTHILSCTVAFVVKCVETILSKIALGISRSYCHKRKLEHMNWEKKIYKLCLHKCPCNVKNYQVYLWRVC